TFRGESAFGSWLYRIVANAAYQKLRGRQSRQRELSLDEVLPFFDESGCHASSMVDWSPRVDDPALQVELRTALTSAIDELPATYRAVLVLRDVEGRSTRQIAETLGLSVPVVKTRVHRARLFLRQGGRVDIGIGGVRVQCVHKRVEVAGLDVLPWNGDDTGAREGAGNGPGERERDR